MMIEFETGFCGLKEVFVEENIAFVVEFEGQEIPFYKYRNDDGSGCYISNISPSGMDNALDYSDNRTSRRLLKVLNDKFVDDNSKWHIGRIGDYYTSTFKIGYVRNMCCNCAYTYAFGCDWDIRCEKGGLESRNDNFIGRYNGNCCENYSQFKK